MASQVYRAEAEGGAATVRGIGMDSSTPSRMRCRYILGMRVDGTTYQEATESIMRWADSNEARYVCEAPVHMVMEAHDSAEYQAVINGADLVTPGGMPVVWMLRASGLRAQPRVYGPTLTLRVCEAAAISGTPVGFYGGTEAALNGLTRRLRTEHPALKIAYACSPPFRELTAAERKQITTDILHSGCRILFVGLGCPKQERWMAEHVSALSLVMLGVGAAFDFLSGQKPQAPAWLQARGLEWLFRLVTEPRRLWFRYLFHNPRFVVLAGAQLLRERRRRSANFSPS
jgi:N-acetylglucosaminyldiphosphoundecaprenol N-acetyl-beta-D-mannosaminyltransferase